MTFEEISEKAFKREALGEYSNLAEKYAHLQLYNLYRDYFQKKIDKQKASEIKNEIKKEFQYYQERIDDYYFYFKKQNEIRIKYDCYLSEIERAKEQDDLLEKSLKFIELIIQDKSFFDRNIEKVN